MLVVIDTDVLVSTAGHPDKRFALWEALRVRRMKAVTSDAAIAEFEAVAARPIVRATLPLLETNLGPFLAEYRSLALLIPAPPSRFELEVDGDPHDVQRPPHPPRPRARPPPAR
jgi:predicted nucleic acid-binding protein